MGADLSSSSVVVRSVLRHRNSVNIRINFTLPDGCARVNHHPSPNKGLVGASELVRYETPCDLVVKADATSPVIRVVLIYRARNVWGLTRGKLMEDLFDVGGERVEFTFIGKFFGFCR